jgi:hypothetical protein
MDAKSARLQHHLSPAADVARMGAWAVHAGIAGRLTLSTASSVASSARSVPYELNPTVAHDFFLLFTYDWLSLRAPTRTTARPGVTPCSFCIASTSALISRVMVAAIALPSMTWAVAGAAAARGMTPTRDAREAPTQERAWRWSCIVVVPAQQAHPGRVGGGVFCLHLAAGSGAGAMRPTCWPAQHLPR